MSSRFDFGGVYRKKMSLVDEFKEKCQEVGGKQRGGPSPRDPVKCVVEKGKGNGPRKQLTLALFDELSGPHASLDVYKGKGAQAGATIRMAPIKDAEISTDEEETTITIRNNRNSVRMSN